MNQLTIFFVLIMISLQAYSFSFGDVKITTETVGSFSKCRFGIPNFFGPRSRTPFSGLSKGNPRGR